VKFHCPRVGAEAFLLQSRLTHAVEEFRHGVPRIGNVLLDPGNREARMRFFYTRKRDTRLLCVGTDEIWTLGAQNSV